MMPPETANSEASKQPGRQSGNATMNDGEKRNLRVKKE